MSGNKDEDTSILDKPVSAKDKTLEIGAAFIQDLSPIKQIHAHLNAFHAYADEPTRAVETNHYCAHLSDDVRQCILYDGSGPNARIVGIEYMVTERVFKTLPTDERKFWHSHVYEVKSGMLIMPGPTNVPGMSAAWETAEKEEMKEVIKLYGKVYHLWQTDRGDELPFGEPKLMTSFTADGQLSEKALKGRDERFEIDSAKKKEARKDIEVPDIHPDADQTWRGR